MISVRPAMCLYVAKMLNIAIFSNIINTVNVKLCMVVLLIELYLFISLPLTLTKFQGCSTVTENFVFLSSIFVACRMVR